MTRSSLATIFRSAARDAVDPDDVARLLAGEHLGARHLAAVEALADSRAASAAWRVSRALEAESNDLRARLRQARDVVPLVQRTRRAVSPSLLPYAAAAGIVALAVALGSFRPAGTPPADLASRSAPVPATTADDLISRYSWEDGAVATVAVTPEAIFVDEFGLPGSG